MTAPHQRLRPWARLVDAVFTVATFGVCAWGLGLEVWMGHAAHAVFFYAVVVAFGLAWWRRR